MSTTPTQVGASQGNTLQVDLLSTETIHEILLKIPSATIDTWMSKKKVDHRIQSFLDTVGIEAVTKFRDASVDYLFIDSHAVRKCSYTQLNGFLSRFYDKGFDPKYGVVFCEAAPPVSLSLINAEGYFASLGMKVIRAHGHAGASALLEHHFDKLLQQTPRGVPRVSIITDYIDPVFAKAIREQDKITTTWLHRSDADISTSPCDTNIDRDPLMSQYTKPNSSDSALDAPPTPYGSDYADYDDENNSPADLITLSDKIVGNLSDPSLPRYKGRHERLVWFNGMDEKGFSKALRDKAVVALGHVTRLLAFQGRIVDRGNVHEVLGADSSKWMKGDELLYWGIKNDLLERVSRHKDPRGLVVIAKENLTDLLPVESLSYRFYGVPATCVVGFET